VQGHLRKSPVEVEIHTTCAHCGEAMAFVIDSDLNHRVLEGGPRPLMFEPEIDWSRFTEPNIIDGY